MANNWAVILIGFGLAGLICIFVVAVIVVLVYFTVQNARDVAKIVHNQPAQGRGVLGIHVAPS